MPCKNMNVKPIVTELFNQVMISTQLTERVVTRFNHSPFCGADARSSMK